MVVKLVNVHTFLAILNLLKWKKMIRLHQDNNDLTKATQSSVMEII